MSDSGINDPSLTSGKMLFMFCFGFLVFFGLSLFFFFFRNKEGLREVPAAGPVGQVWLVKVKLLTLAFIYPSLINVM